MIVNNKNVKTIFYDPNNINNEIGEEELTLVTKHKS